MPRLYLLGGENVFKRSAKEVNEQAFQAAGERPTVIVFPWARASFDRRYAKRKLLSDYLISLGAASVNFIDYSEPHGSIAQKMAESNLIYLTGGLANVFVSDLKIVGVDSLLCRYSGVIVGRSAGALTLCRKCIVTYRSTSKIDVIDGLPAWQISH